jgi:hypothetical protein
VRKQILYQLADIQDHQIQALIRNSPDATSCTEKYGWLTPQTTLQVRNMMAQRREALQQRLDPASIEYQLDSSSSAAAKHKKKGAKKSTTALVWLHSVACD